MQCQLRARHVAGTCLARRWHPAFAKALDELLEEVELSLEFQLGCLGNNVVPMDEGAAGDGESAVPPVEGVRFDPEAESS
jgi:hypothetical protein